jgi:hypothetical protein
MVLPAMPMVVLLGGVTWLTQAQDLLRHLVVAVQPEWMTGPAAAMMQLHPVNQLLAGDPGGSPALPVALAVVFVVTAIAFQLAYLDRVALSTGAEADPVHLAAEADAVRPRRRRP